MSDILYTHKRIEFNLDTDLDLSTADEVAIFYTMPNKTTGRWTGTAATDVINYTTSVTDIIMAGDWKFQANARFGSEWKFGEPIIRTFVNGNL